MQTPEENIFPEEKNLGTRYIYTTEGELIPATEEEHLTSEQLNAETPSLQVDYRYEPEEGVFVENVSNNPPKSPKAEDKIEDNDDGKKEEDKIENLLISNPAIEIERDEEDEEEEEDESKKIDNANIEKESAIEEDAAEEMPKEGDQMEDVDLDIDDPDKGGDGQVEVKKVEAVAKGTSTSKLPRGRKPKTEVPLHILGHDMNKPMEDVVNGKSPKPRLGVKVPYRNLTSQIVSKAEIENEIIERGKKKLNEKKELTFARQITSRLARKLAPPSLQEAKKRRSQEEQQHQDNNNDDLLAILEGGDGLDDDSGSAAPSSPPFTAPEGGDLENLEREIALKQLQELPYLVPKKGGTKTLKVYEKGGGQKSVSSFSDQIFENRAANSGGGNSAPSSAGGHNKKPNQKNAAPRQGEEKRASSFDGGGRGAALLSPQIKVNQTTLKTYSRKRKSSFGEGGGGAVAEDFFEAAGAAEAVPPPSPVYVTKSSRIIKKKIIWDPDEAVSPKPKPTPTPTPTPSPSPSKIEKKDEQKKSAKKSGRSEVDRLLGDEGAIKMLYELKRSEGKTKISENLRKFPKISSEEDLTKKANQIKSDLTKTTSLTTPPSKSLRKKFQVPKMVKQRQISKDSTRSTPPASPPAFGHSYLIRRRSSSSISTTGSEDDDKSKKTEKQPKRTKNEHFLEKYSNFGPYKTFQLTKSTNNRIISIELNNSDDTLSTNYYFTSEVLHELTLALTLASEDHECHVVMVTSHNDLTFGRGLNYDEVEGAVGEEEREKRARTLAHLVKDFLSSLVHCPKITIAGVQGECHGLTCTMLPLFDVVVASDAATFSVPTSVQPEFAFLLAAPYVARPGLVAELIYANQTLDAQQMLKSGLVTKLCFPEQFGTIIDTTVDKVAAGSIQVLESTKRQSKAFLRQHFDADVEVATTDLIQNWTSKEFLKKKIEKIF